MKLFNIHIVFILTFPLFDRVLLTILSDSKGQRFKAVQLRGANSPRSIYQNSQLIPRPSLLFLHLVSFSLCSSLFWEFRENEIRKASESCHISNMGYYFPTATKNLFKDVTDQKGVLLFFRGMRKWSGHAWREFWRELLCVSVQVQRQAVSRLYHRRLFN